nr:class I SAM-dependent methyltransferase [uncultured Methanospirillum sp.]
MSSEFIDWNVTWNHKRELCQSARNNIGNREYGNSLEWAHEFVQYSKDNPDRIEKMLSSLPITSATKILDIGSGPGSITIPAAKIASHVTAVEPASGMATVLLERARTENVDKKITVIQKKWEDIDPDSDLFLQYDLVVAANSLDMKDISVAIDKMIRVCSGEIWLYWFAGPTTIEIHYKKLWPLLFNRPFPEGPKSDIIFQVLYNKGIYPDISFERTELVQSYNTIDEAVEKMRTKIGCNPDYDDTIKWYLSTVLIQQKGVFIDKTVNTRAIFKWKVNST